MVQEGELMSNVFDYLTWRNDLPFSVNPVNAVDSLIFSCLSYLRLQPAIQKQSEISIRDASAFFKQAKPEEIQYRVQEDMELLHKMAEGSRYQDVLLCGYIDHLDASMEKQFSAVTCLLDDQLMLIAFRGTDNTLVGWKEDFNMTFMDTIPSQLEAVRYVETMAAAYPNHRIVLCGHSKGGNLAVYAGACCSSSIQSRIQTVFNHDGPGFSKAVLQGESYRQIAGRIETFVPQSSVVGMLLEHEEHYTVISSNQISLWQHDPYSWEVLGADFIRLDRVDKQSVILDAAIKQWISELDRSQREAFIDAIFQILSNTNAASFKEMNENRMRSTALILKALNSTDKQTRKMLSDITFKLMASAKSAIEGNLSKDKTTK